MPKISIILPNYNYAHYLPQRINSIIAQTYFDFELIILDDASTDQSCEIIERYKQKDSRIVTLYNQTNSGNPFVQWKKGIEFSKGEYIWIAEADDWCEPEFLEILLPKFTESKQIDLVYSQSNIADVNGNVISNWVVNSNKVIDSFGKSFIVEGNCFIENSLIHENVVPNASAVVFRKSAYIKVGGVNTMLKTNADWLLWLTILLQGKVCFEQKPLNYFRRHNASVIAKSNSKAQSYKEQYDYTMRKLFHYHLKKLRIDNKHLIRKINDTYIGYDIGNKALWELANKNYLTGFWLLVQSFFILHSFGYIRKAINRK